MWPIWNRVCHKANPFQSIWIQVIGAGLPANASGWTLNCWQMFQWGTATSGFILFNQNVKKWYTLKYITPAFQRDVSNKHFTDSMKLPLIHNPEKKDNWKNRKNLSSDWGKKKIKVIGVFFFYPLLNILTCFDWMWMSLKYICIVFIQEFHYRRIRA